MAKPQEAEPWTFTILQVAVPSRPSADSESPYAANNSGNAWRLGGQSERGSLTDTSSSASEGDSTDSEAAASASGPGRGPADAPNADAAISWMVPVEPLLTPQSGRRACSQLVQLHEAAAEDRARA